jgi:hypothetical protein
MKLTASILTVFAASILILQSCSSDTTSDKNELVSVLDEAANREGVPSGECRTKCVAAALAVFDECEVGIDGREVCFGQAIHAFFECAKECPPPTCEDRCQLAALAVLEECLEGPDPGGDEAACAKLAREAYAECILENCEDLEPPTCEDRCENAATKMRDECVADDGNVDECNMEAREWLAACTAEHCEEPPTCEDACGAIATHVYDACIIKIDSEERCAEIARGIQWLCNKHCEGYECPCHGDDDCDDEDSDSDSDSGSDSDSHGGSDSDSHGDSDSGKHCDPDGPTPKKGGHCK